MPKNEAILARLLRCAIAIQNNHLNTFRSKSAARRKIVSIGFIVAVGVLAFILYVTLLCDVLCAHVSAHCNHTRCIFRLIARIVADDLEGSGVARLRVKGYHFRCGSVVVRFCAAECKQDTEGNKEYDFSHVASFYKYMYLRKS